MLILVWAATARAATLFDPALKFRVLPTEHFLIYFHQGEEPLAGRLAVLAEETWQALLATQGMTPPRLTHVVLVDQSDSTNGWATPVPRNTVMVTAAWPTGSDFIGNTDDWLRVVFTHEFAHIVHLDRSKSWARVVRGIFGRVAVAFPNLFLPTWQIEGLATYYESALTGGGRLHAGDFGAIVSEAARRGRLEPLDRVNGGLTDWPGGLGPYAYGLGFHRYLADRYGAERLAALADRTAGRVPYFASTVFQAVYGASLGELWKQYLATLIATAPAGSGNATRRTRDGFAVAGPRFDRHACPGCTATVFYSVRTPHGFPTFNQVTLDGADPQPVATRYLGSTAAIGRETIYFDQQETRRNAGVYSDLYALDRGSGRVVQITDGARFRDPDLSPDQSTLVCVRDTRGRRDLVLVRLKPDTTENTTTENAITQDTTSDPVPRDPVPPGSAAPDPAPPDPAVSGFSRTLSVETLISEPETQFDAPRWSPDGRAIVVERHRLGAWSEIVIVDVDTRAVSVVASADRIRFVTPTWRPDGGSIVAAMARDDETFNLYEFTVGRTGSPRRLTNTTGGATWPDVSPDGKTIVYVGYTVDGFDVFTMPYPALPAPPASPAPPARSAPPARPTRPARPAPAAKYLPWPTLKPTWWSPIVDGDSERWKVGAATGGFDVLGYHAYSLSASWLVLHPDAAPWFNAASPDWNVSYAYTRWRPNWWVSASTATSFFGGGPQASVGTLRERELAAGVVIPIRHVRVSHTAVGSIVHGIDDLTLPDGKQSHRRTALRGGWSTKSVRTYGFSIGPQEGAAVGITAEVVRRALGSDADAGVLTIDVRGYVPVLVPHHVLALRLAAGVSTGDRTTQRKFLLGGPSPNADVLDFGRRAVSLLRGFPTNTFAGSRVALLNVDYRFSLARPQRGVGTWPVFVHTTHGAAFADVGHAWIRRFAARDVKTSIGGELSADIVVGYSFRFTATAGAAWGHDGSGRIPNRATTYLRVGHAF